MVIIICSLKEINVSNIYKHIKKAYLRLKMHMHLEPHHHHHRRQVGYNSGEVVGVAFGQVVVVVVAVIVAVGSNGG